MLLFSTQTGTVKWFDYKKGYGFVTPDDGSEDIFVHQTVIHASGFRSLAVRIESKQKNKHVVVVVVAAAPPIYIDLVTGPVPGYMSCRPRLSLLSHAKLMLFSP